MAAASPKAMGYVLMALMVVGMSVGSVYLITVYTNDSQTNIGGDDDDNGNGAGNGNGAQTTTMLQTTTSAGKVITTPVTTTIAKPYLDIKAWGQGALLDDDDKPISGFNLRTLEFTGPLDPDTIIDWWAINVRVRIQSNRIDWSRLIVRYDIYLCDTVTKERVKLIDTMKLSTDVTQKYIKAAEEWTDEERTFYGPIGSAIRKLELKGLDFRVPRKVELVHRTKIEAYDKTGARIYEAGTTSDRRLYVGFRSWLVYVDGKTYLYLAIEPVEYTGGGKGRCIVCPYIGD